MEPTEKKEPLTFEAAMGLNRADRRKLSKVNNGLKIPGVMKPYIKNEDKR